MPSNISSATTQSATAPPPAGQTGVMVPLYSYPGSYWTQVIQAKNAHPSVPIVAIINPNSGPGSSSDPNYVSGIQQLQAAGVKVLGYVYTSYGARSASTVESDINSYNNWYHVNGIFFDEMANTAGLETYYSSLSGYTKSLGMTMTVGNPGTDTLSSYIGTMDVLDIYENPGMPALTDLTGWHTSYPKSNFGLIAFGVGSLPIQSTITTDSTYVGYVYITDDVLPNPYDTVPSYLSTEVGMLDTGSTLTIPQSPTSLTATTISSSQINLSWTAPSNNGGSAITGYKIERSTDSGITWSTIVANTASVSTTYSDSGLAASTAYTYRVSAINIVGTSPPSNTATTITSGTVITIPGSPTSLTATTISSSQINLSWTAPSNNGGSAITGYKIERSTDSGITWSTIVANTASVSTTYSDTGLASNTAYTYRVSAINSVGTGSPSNTASATTSSGTTTGSIILNSVKTTSGTVSSLPYQITLSNVNAGTGTNRLLVVGVSANNNHVASVTFGGVPLTNKAASFANNDAEFWYLTNPSGTGNIVVTMAGSTSVVVGAYSFSGVDQTTPIPTSITNHNTVAGSPTISITTQYPNSWVLDLPAIYGGVTLGSPTCTQQWDTNMPSAITGASSSSVKTSAGLATCGWTASGSGDLWDDAAIEIKASG
ncbi:putative spherulin 4 [Candidatus Nitrosotalea okcheonensis]|uniref:Putative spherulin 4 n=2 Tax=Candidatus Nitrosotalea okcheonensis TaxID=1903276 RepID=A0A2H1FFA0_9ARCH|nr:putative spherulin 4 [Candidatus Nitrosotalea okcheonensis]